MAKVEVRDRVIWTKHIHGDEALREKLSSLPAGSSVQLRVAGREGFWRKMKDNQTTGTPTPGLSPIGPARSLWSNLYRMYKPMGGAVVDVELLEGGQLETPPGTSGWEWPDPQESEAAWQAFLETTKAGWRSQGPYGPRDELYERDGA